MASHGVTLLGDDLYSNQPLYKLLLPHGRNFIFVCKPASHATLYERLAFWQASDGIKEHESRHWNGRFTAITLRRSINDVFLRGGCGALSVKGFELAVDNSTTGEQLAHHSCITKHPLTTESVARVARAGRGRWKIEPENYNLKSQPDSGRA